MFCYLNSTDKKLRYNIVTIPKWAYSRINIKDSKTGAARREYRKYLKE